MVLVVVVARAPKVGLGGANATADARRAANAVMGFTMVFFFCACLLYFVMSLFDSLA